MHELSIAMSIIDVTSEEAGRRGAARIAAVHVRIGALAGVVKEALMSAFDMASEGTPLDGSRLVITEMPVVVHCPRCRAARELESIQWFVCNRCGTATSQILQGQELEVVALELEE